MRRFTFYLSLAVALLSFQFIAEEVRAESAFFNTYCAGCHSGVTSTCAGCHAHGTHSSSSKSDINLTGKTNKSSYNPGEAVSVTISGGYRSGWVRAILYDQNMVELARSTGPKAMGGGAGLPVTLSATAPSVPGTYSWKVAWYGNQYDLSQVGGKTVFGAGWTPDPNNANHGQEIVSTNSFTVTSAAAPDVNLNPTALNFGTLTVGGSATLNSQVQNLGSATLNVTAINACSGTSSEFTSSPAAPFSVAAGGSQNLSVTYAPVDGTVDSGCLQIVSNDPVTAVATLNLSGAGTVPASQVLDIDISGFSASRRVSLSRGKSVQLKLTAVNPGTVSGSADASLVGVQGGVTVYSQTITLNVAAGVTASYVFPPYLPTALGEISWTMSIADQDPDLDVATAVSKIVR